MKHLLILFLICISFSTFSQTFKGAIAAGINASQVDGDNDVGYRKVGFNVGPKVYAMLNDHFSLSMELLFSQKGAKASALRYSPQNLFKIQLNYAEVPLMVHFHDKEKAIFGLGVSYGQLYDYNVTQGGDDITENIQIKSRDLNILADVTFKFLKDFGINGRFGYSIVPIAHWESSNFKNNAVYNNFITIRAMYFF